MKELLIKTVNKLQGSFYRGSTESIDEAITNEIKKITEGPQSTSKMNGLIEIVNKLQDIFSHVSADVIDLPQIVVIGNQSAGKSSVLESLVRRNFLPRGTGIVTRCPLVLQLVHCPFDNTEYRSEEKGTLDNEEWGEFLHLKDKVFFDFDDIRKEIENYTVELAGDNKGICGDKITLKIYSPNVVNLTLVDLPGITKVAVGDQPEDIEEQIKELVFTYITKPNSIILAVSAANVDMATSEALKFAKLVDPLGVRTLAVITKLDLMDKGTDAGEVLSGKVIPVKLGIIGVVNRSQQAINTNKNIEEQLNMEAEFLEKNYPDLADVNGTPFLEDTLSQILIRHIKTCLPQLTKKINSEISKYQDKLKALGKVVVDKESTLANILTTFGENYSKAITNTISADSESISKLFKIINHDFKLDLAVIASDVNIPEDLFDETLDSYQRPKLLNFPSFDEAFEKAVPETIRSLGVPSLACAEKVRKELNRLIENCGVEARQELKRFPKLREKIFHITKKLITERWEVAKEKIEDIIAMESAYMNKAHPHFDRWSALKTVGFGQSYIKKHRDGDHEEFLSVLEELEPEEKREVARGFVENYLKVERTIVQDSVTKAIMHFFVDNIKTNLQPKLIVSIFNPETVNEMMEEPKNVSKKREDFTKTLDALKQGSELIAEISQMDVDIKF